MASQDHLLNFAQKSQPGQGQNLFTHVTKLIQASVNEKNPVRGIEKIEVLSNHLKNTEFRFKEPEQDTQLNSKKRKEGAHHQYLEAAKVLAESAEAAKTSNVILPNLQQEYKALKIAGISLGENNYQILAKVLKVLAVDKKAKQLRFWGKILGFHDYWVIQGLTTRKNADEVGKNVEVQGSGINYYTYWVAHDLLGKWVELPTITPEQLKGAKEIKYVFSGDLDKTIEHFPPYQGKEKHLLKAQIVRITHTCELAPKGLYKLNEENPTIIDFEDEFKLPEIAEQNSLDSWIHASQYILHQGRCSYYVDPSLSEEQRELINTENGEKDPIVDRLKPISEDKPLEKLGFTTNWGIQLVGESQIINLVGKQEGQSTSYGVIHLKNLTWPGASTIGYSGGWTNIYIGYGQKVIQSSFNPIKPNDFAVEGEDRPEFREPNPSKPIPPAVVDPAEAPKADEPAAE